MTKTKIISFQPTKEARRLLQKKMGRKPRHGDRTNLINLAIVTALNGVVRK